MEKQTAPRGLAVDELLDNSLITKSLRERIERADENKDGILSVDEFLQVVQSEQKAVSENGLFRRFVWLLAISLLLMTAALVGCIYAVVDLTQQV